jgi:adenine-specific DNA-methyltransferase
MQPPVNVITPRKAINKAFLKVKPNRSEIERFKTNLMQLIDRINDHESEEFHKNLVTDFLKKTYYDPGHFINTKGRNDLVIHNGDKATSTVGVIIEAKKPANKGAMLSREHINVKAFHELVLYYLRERVTHNNIEIKYLIATNIYEWFIFDATVFERLFARNKNLVNQFSDFESGRLADTKTDFFYKYIAEPFIAGLNNEIEFTWFNISNYEKPLRNNDPSDDNKLISLFKLLSPEHLLKLPFINDSNSLDKRFYSELLHIIGLTETKEGGKKLIGRSQEGQRNKGSFLENAIIQLDSLDKISRLENQGRFGSNHEERLFNVGLELSITWINRILFLKLLEAQLISYHKDNKSFGFLNTATIKDYDDLNSLFFQVLARKQHERNEELRILFSKVPYLNSSLFEPTEIEHTTIFISNLSDDYTLPVYMSTVLKDITGKKKTGNLHPLQYLFEFLDAYDFAGEGSEEIQEENKTLINASVLGLIFEKINGYKDGSFFTPGFITMYMCRETIRRAVIQKFNEAKGWNCSDFTELYNLIEDSKEANTIVNSLKICDPAVGSGHFLVSALNEIIAVKSDLKILQDSEGRRLKEYNFEVVNDELIVTDEDGELFEYNPANKESQRIQEILFHEKQTIIENSLFGVDINSNSVKICRLRLWIELLKNAYYKNEHELETLPNIDINIKCGNSLISRFVLNADLKQALRKSASKWTVDSYRMAVSTYRHASSKEEKRMMEKLIDEIKTNFRSEIAANDPVLKKLQNKKLELFNHTNQQKLFAFSAKEKAEWNNKVTKLTAEIAKLESEIEAIRNNKVYENAFEWRFEFPEVLDDQGDFTGFDVVIGNPPYIRQEEISHIKSYLQTYYETYAGTADLYVYFVERGLQIAKNNGYFVYILPNKWMRAGYGNALRKWVGNYTLQSIIDFGDLPVFEEATTYPCLLNISKTAPVKSSFDAVRVDTLNFPKGIGEYVRHNAFSVNHDLLSPDGWTLVNDAVQLLIDKIKSKGVPLGEYVKGKIYYGIKTGYNEAFVIDEITRNRLIAEDPKSAKIIKPFLAGRDVKRYQQPKSDKYLIFTRRGINIDEYPAIKKHLAQFKDKLEPKPNDYKGKEWNGRKPGSYKWYEIQDAVDYFGEFENEKIVFPNICKQPEFAYDKLGIFTNQKCFIIPKGSKYLMAILNSKLTFFLFMHILPKLRGNFYEPSYIYFKTFPIFNLEETENIETLVDQIHNANQLKDIFPLESQIDQLVYQLYDLTPDEIAIVESVVK